MKTRSRDLLAISGVLLVNAIQVWLVFGRSIPSTYNWFLHWATISETKLPYRDFFYPFPPGSLWLHGSLPNSFSDPVFAEQIIASLIWMLSALVIYCTLRIWFSVSVAFSATVIATIAYFTRPFNIIAGYFESGSMLLLSAMALTIYSFKSDTTRNRRLTMFFIAGVLFSFSALVKQTFALPLLVALIGLGYILLFGQKREQIRFTKAEYVMVLVGACLPLIFVCLYLMENGAFEQFVFQVFSGSAKAPSASNFLEWSLGGLVSDGSLIAATLILGSAFSLVKNKVDQSNEQPKRFYLTAILLFGIIAIVSPKVFLDQKTDVKGLVLVYIIFALASFYYVWLQTIKHRASIESKKQVLSAFLILGALALVGFKVATGPSIVLAADAWSFLMTLGGITVLLAILVFTLTHQGRYHLWIPDGYRQITILWLWVMAAHIFAGSLSGGLSLELLFPATAFALALVSHFLVSTSKNLVILVVPPLALSLLSMVSFQLNNPYTWWGINEPPISILTGKAPNSVDYLRNTRIASEESRQYYSRIQQMVSSSSWNGITLVSAPRKTLAGPNNAGVIETFGLEPYGLNCPILWWDVCPEELIVRDALEIVSNPPEIILWNMPPEWVQVAHEEAFRDGKKSSLRTINRWVAAQAKGNRYELIGKINIPDKKKSEWNTWILVEREDFISSRREQESTFRP